MALADTYHTLVIRSKRFIVPSLLASLSRLIVDGDRYIVVEYSIIDFLSLGSRQPLYVL